MREDTKLINFPLFCPKCKHKALVNIYHGNITDVKKSDVKPKTLSLQRTGIERS
ncbi:TPA: hypothetical protein KN238_001610 [Clostridioides difficile]|nr:cysteine-rich KTR domain-containing protein [Clostridioides difficile]HBF2806998.1 hypothetical protein [Clostridioides difficile]HBF3757074.1 hypothetical protein [Clostridioides difficile]HBF6248365.1 hypothetical protein [Clostridioides difficile]HBY3220291.1 hypothetical protein [Clostridioides difficile]